MENLISNGIADVPIIIYEQFKSKQSLFDYIKHPVILEMFYSRTRHFHILPPEPSKFVMLDDTKFDDGEWLIDVGNWLWRYSPKYHRISHLYSMRTGISACGKENIRNIPSFDLFSNYGNIKKCKLCLRTTIGRIIK